MPNGVDHVADFAKGGREMSRLARLHTFPEYVKAADIQETCEPRQLGKTQYADTVRNQFPCHTKASTWLSALFYQTKRAGFHPKDQQLIDTRINSMVRYWGIAADVAPLKTVTTKSAAEALPDSDFLYVKRTNDGTERYLPVRSPVEVKAAAVWLKTHCDTIPYADRQQIATRLLAKAAAYGASITDHLEFLEKQAGRGVCDPLAVAKMLEDRAYLTGGRGTSTDVLRTAMKKMAATVRESPRQTLQPDTLTKLAETVDTFDRAIGLIGRYTDKLPRPEDVLFSETFSKVANARQAVVATVTGKIYEKASLAKVSSDDLRDLLGEEFASHVTGPFGVDVEKLAETLHTLPRPDAVAFEGLLSEAGVSPLYTKTAASALHDDDLEGLAAAYYTSLNRVLGYTDDQRQAHS